MDVIIDSQGFKLNLFGSFTELFFNILKNPLDTMYKRVPMTTFECIFCEKKIL